MTVIGICPMIWESRARHSGLGPAGNGPNKCNNFASLERAASPQHSLKLHAIGVSLSVRRWQNGPVRCHQLQHLCRETKFQEILQNPPKMGFRSTAHGSIRIQEGEPNKNKDLVARRPRQTFPKFVPWQHPWQQMQISNVSPHMAPLDPPPFWLHRALPSTAVGT